jgi:hypothetical protein
MLLEYIFSSAKVKTIKFANNAYKVHFKLSLLSYSFDIYIKKSVLAQKL